MGTNSIFIQRIFQKDRTRFTIEWTDGKIQSFRLSDLQKQCLCARCRDEKTGKLLIDLSSIDEELEAVRICNVGRYAIKIDFSKGCSKGIFTFNFLRQLKDAR